MPGARELLEALDDHDHLHLALLTGNYREAAEIKLQHFELWDFFEWGAFSDDAADRNALVPIARSRAETYDIPGRGDRARDRDRRHAARHRMRARRRRADRSRSRPAASRWSSCARPARTKCCRICQIPKRCWRCCCSDCRTFAAQTWQPTADAKPAWLTRRLRHRARRVGGSAWESNPACPARRQRPILKTGRATGPRSLPLPIISCPTESAARSIREPIQYPNNRCDLEQREAQRAAVLPPVIDIRHVVTARSA